ncbi:hypothetical protein AtNW77_Chr4g0274281 [Arabidopsis thaliana]|uniref:Uncharacterized protein n=3 Tax=Arabidopsis TaxID=3701 RepID=A0A384L6B4_ARATH|nr:uncharacterized protein AT4G02140 [Arabidopsis thaliana]NP_192123.1 uncharacterized protein AT4G02140 [Arabidopsis thaliana]KAG7614843.1 hypothetical protein ISN45_At04g002530 [Arabidopsis thaliana x Arabidopsis arenosa]AAC78705.1 hypothetical protein [Arabidopsis thaliana]AAS76216.1 At4g02140 [Arabidopsis thaliana]AAS88765.1 At4g02140 [Arabidopsis thaliana]AEE82130.1 hypothetical protein AT4G02140 [Arabidopsis thaliana]|eukprot:NP_001319842.1 hypothetical protein AT4G02140 [Arabidopsis thaliana]
MLSSPAFAAARSTLGRRLHAKRLSSSTGRTADPEIHARNDGDEPSLFPSDPEGLDDVANPKTPADEDVPDIRPPGFVKEPLSPPKNPRDTSHKLESTPVGLPADLNFQQKRN